MADATALYVTDDALISSLDVFLHSVSVNVDASGGYITIYNGRDAVSGNILAKLIAPNNETKQLRWEPPIPCPNGIYVVLSSSATDATIHYSPVGPA